MTPRVFITKPMLRHKNNPRVIVQLNKDLFVDVGMVVAWSDYFWIQHSLECSTEAEFLSYGEIIEHFSQPAVFASIQQRMATC